MGEVCFARYNPSMTTKCTYTLEALLDIHARTHTSLRKLLKHCSELTDQQLNKKLKGFGSPSIHAQLFHIIMAEHYWISVAKDAMDISMRPEHYPTIKELQSFLRRTGKATKDYLDSTSTKELNTARMMPTYGGKSKKLTPALLLLRTQTHAFQHQGQILAMCRIMDHPGPKGLDFPLKP